MPRFNQSDIQYVFIFFLAACLGVAVAWLTPPFSIPDEGAHYLRSIEVGRGHLVNSRGNVGVPLLCREYLVIAKQYAPVAFYQDIAEKMLPNSEECMVSSVNTAGAYSPIPYIAGALGIRVAEYFGHSIETRLKLGRLANVIATSIICLLSVLVVQRYRPLLAVLIFLPMNIWLRASLSADAITISISILYLSYILHLQEKQSLITPRIIANLSLLAIFMGSMKPVYGLLSFSSLILLNYSLVRRPRLLEIMALVLPGLTAFIISSMWAVAADPSLVYINLFGGANPTLQLHYIFSDPINFLHTIGNTFRNDFTLFIGQALLPTLGVSTWIPQQNRLLIASIFCIFLLFTMVTTPASLLVWQRMVLLGVASTCLLVVLIPSYLTYTLVGFNKVLGLQGRYFLPLLFYAIFAGAISKPRWLYANDSLRLIIAVVIPMIISTSFVIYYLV